MFSFSWISPSSWKPFFPNQAKFGGWEEQSKGLAPLWFCHKMGVVGWIFHEVLKEQERKWIGGRRGNNGWMDGWMREGWMDG